MHKRGPCSKMCAQLQPKKTKVKLLQQKALMHCALLTGWSMALAADIMLGHGLSNKMRPQLQPKKTNIRLY